MSSNIANQAPFLRTTRNFPYDIQPLVVELNRSYDNIASCVNERTIGLFSTTAQSITGERWFVNSNQPNQSLRQAYTFTASGNIPHNLAFNNIVSFTNGYGSFTDGTNYYGVIYGSSVSIDGQVSFYITPTDIVILSGSGAPVIVSGILVIEWLSNKRSQ